MYKKKPIHHHLIEDGVLLANMMDGRLFIITIAADQIFAEEILVNANGIFVGRGVLLSENDYILVFDSKNSEFIKAMIPEGESGYKQIEFIDEYSLKQAEKR